jgi:hypothetical protein
MQFTVTWAVVLICAAPACQSRVEPIVVAVGASCGDRHCVAIAGACQAQNGGSEAGTTCDWNGTACTAVQCGEALKMFSGGDTPADCPAGSVCDAGVCQRLGASTDRTACRTDDDCVPEPCCRPTHCVSRADAVCRTAACCTCLDCLPRIDGCRCINGCCVTQYGNGCK